MFRLLFWIALIAAAVWLWRRFNRPARPTPSATQEHEAAPMVRCAQCGVHIPQDKALPQGAQWYCSQAHLDQHQQ